MSLKDFIKFLIEIFTGGEKKVSEKKKEIEEKANRIENFIFIAGHEKGGGLKTFNGRNENFN